MEFLLGNYVMKLFPPVRSVVSMWVHLLTHCCVLQGSARRKKKVVHRTATADDKKLQFSLKKLGVNNISGIEEVLPNKQTKYIQAIFIKKQNKTCSFGSC